jgi:hypothetical protein
MLFLQLSAAHECGRVAGGPLSRYWVSKVRGRQEQAVAPVLSAGSDPVAAVGPLRSTGASGRFFRPSCPMNSWRPGGVRSSPCVIADDGRKTRGHGLKEGVAKILGV